MSWERVLAPNIPAGSRLRSYLDSFGFQTRLKRVNEDGLEPELVLVGGSVSVEFAVRVIRLSRDKMRSLRFAFLTADEPSYEPEERHYEVFIGAPMGSQHRQKCRVWELGDWEKLSETMSLPEFHSYVRNFYRLKSSATHTTIEFIGGPRDGFSIPVHGLPEDQPSLFFMSSPIDGEKILYRREICESRVYYRFDARSE